MPETPLRAEHEALGARFTDFGGWEMPVQYEGVIAEHQAVRARWECSMSATSDASRCPVPVQSTPCGHFCAMTSPRSSRDAPSTRWPSTNTVGLPTTSSSGGWSLRRCGCCPTASTSTASRTVSARRSGGNVRRATPRGTALLAVQGPAAADLVTDVIGEMPRRFRLITRPSRACRSSQPAPGTPASGALRSWSGRGRRLAVARLVAAGAVPCGLGARDTLRLEMGFPLWGQDLTEETTPLEAGLGWVVDWDHDFVGKASLEEQQSDGIEQQLVAFRSAGRRSRATATRCGPGRHEARSPAATSAPCSAAVLGWATWRRHPTLQPRSRSRSAGTGNRSTSVEPPFLEK